MDRFKKLFQKPTWGGWTLIACGFYLLWRHGSSFHTISTVAVGLGVFLVIGRALYPKL